jgi:hypothetical protein
MRRADLADLTAFVAVADNLSFRAAASHIGVTPSALSRTDAAARGAPCGPASGTRCLGTASCRLRDPSPVPFRRNGIAFRDRGTEGSNPAPSSGESSANLRELASTCGYRCAKLPHAVASLQGAQPDDRRRVSAT